ncbi:MAG TPA: NAD(P)H-binding protein [Streptosporangiaceae bacterium]|nr:NAD(P)H-binding protein [Streptosporangiaceae bacterium]
MRLTIFGATGGTGACLTEQALGAGHDVTAVVRDPARLTVSASASVQSLSPLGARLHVSTADVMDPAAIIPAMAGADAVLTAIGPRGTGATTVSQDSVRSIIAAMRKAGARRLLTVSGSIVADEGESPYLRLIKPVARHTFLRHVCTDMRAAEAEIEATDLDWTIMRPPRLTGGPATGHYRTRTVGGLPGSLTLSRADLAACMLSAIDDPAAVRTHIAIAN